MINIDSLQFDTADWQLLEQNQDEIVWQNDRDAAFVTLHYFSKPPDIPCALSNLGTLRDAYRQGVASVGGGLVHAEVIKLKQLDCVDILLKVPQEPSGMTYISSMTFPFAQFSYVIKIQAEEMGMTGFRDSVVAAMLMEQGEDLMNPNVENPGGWFSDPYDPAFKGPVLRNKSDSEEYDEQFAAHPLSRVRRILRSIKETLNPSEDLYAAKKFAI